MRRLLILALLLFFPMTPSFAQGPCYGHRLYPAPTPYWAHPCPPQVPYDIQFLDTLMQHNRDAVLLMQLGQTRARSPQLRALAQQILYERRAEIPPMTQIRRRLGGFTPPYVNFGMPGMISIESQIARLSTAPSDKFDQMFLTSAIMIQQAGVRLCEDALAKTRDPSVRGLASLIRNKLGQSLVALQQVANSLG